MTVEVCVGFTTARTFKIKSNESECILLSYLTVTEGDEETEGGDLEMDLGENEEDKREDGDEEEVGEGLLGLIGGGEEGMRVQAPKHGIERYDSNLSTSF